LNPNASRGPAHAGPRIFLALATCLLLAGPARTAGALDWIPPPGVTALLPGGTFAPSSSHALELCVRSNGPGVSLNWSATASGQFPLTLAPSSGTLVVPANGVATASVMATLPDTALGVASLSVVVTMASSGSRVARAEAAVFAATGGRPEVRPVPGTWQASAGTVGSVSFEIHSLSGSSETVVVTTGRYDPDPNNQGALFSGTGVPPSVLLSAGGTVTVSAPTTIPTNSYGGNANAVQVNITSNGGISTATGYALTTSPPAGSLPTALYPVGLTPLDEAAAGRDGPALLAARGYLLIPEGTSGVRVMRSASTDSIGAVDMNGDGNDDRWLGTIRIPSYAAALGVIPGFVAASGDTLDLGLLAAGRAGLMLLDLRSVEDPAFGAWEDFYDTDGNGIDDRILRTIPLGGFATDVAWFRAPSGRAVALVADADTGSVPVSVSYNPALTVPGTGWGVVAVDVAAALDSLGPVPYAAGTLATPGSALDLELRGGSAPTLAVADGAPGLEVYSLTAASGAPAMVTFTPRGSVALSTAWGTPYARDVAWVSNTKDSLYAAVAASAGGLQIIRVPLTGPPTLVIAQQTLAPSIGVAGTWTGTLAAALGSGGIALFTTPGAGYLDRILSGAGAPYTAPVVLARGAAWAATGLPLEVASHQAASSTATALRFRQASGPMPDILASDGPRVLVLRPGQAAVTGVAEEGGPSPPSARALSVRVAPNPARERVAIEVVVARSATNAVTLAGEAAPPTGALTVEVFDLRGRLVRRIPSIAGTPRVRVLWDGRDDSGRRVASGRYWARVVTPEGEISTAAPLLILR
jgi:hypothetical protein